VDSERVISIIPNVTLKAGFLGFASKQITLVLTDQRVIFARVTTAMLQEAVADASDGATAQGKGPLGQLGARLSAHSVFAKRYLEMPPSQILAETDGNFAIDRSTITKTKITTEYSGGEDANTTDVLIIKTAEKKHKMILGSSRASAKEALEAAGLM
jgi:hypothetical protein